MVENGTVTKAIEYILKNISDNLTLENVAEHCHLSISHLSRIFKEQTGQSVYAFIKKIKMEQSAMRLKMESGKSITDIGGDYGYSASNYSSAFALYHKISPKMFRTRVHQKKENEQEILDRLDSITQVEYKQDYTVMYERAIGNYEELKTAWCDFIEKNQKYVTEDTIFFERTFDDPTIADQDHCIYDICMTVAHPETFENTTVLQGGKFLVCSFKGYLSGIYALNQELVGVYFPARGYEIDQRYAYDQYRKIGEEGYMEFDICIPVK